MTTIRLADTEAVLPLEDMPGYQELVARLGPATVQELYGHNYYIPAGADVTMMIYNKQLFEEAGLDPEAPPTTWQEFLDAAEKIQALPAREDGSQVYGTVFWNDALAWGGWWGAKAYQSHKANQAMGYFEALEDAARLGGARRPRPHRVRDRPRGDDQGHAVCVSEAPEVFRLNAEQTAVERGELRRALDDRLDTVTKRVGDSRQVI